MRLLFFKSMQNYSKKQIATSAGLIFGVCAHEFVFTKSCYASFDLCAHDREWLCASSDDWVGLSRGGLR
jgi:hypothetical protein